MTDIILTKDDFKITHDGDADWFDLECTRKIPKGFPGNVILENFAVPANAFFTFPETVEIKGNFESRCGEPISFKKGLYAKSASFQDSVTAEKPVQIDSELYVDGRLWGMAEIAVMDGNLIVTGDIHAEAGLCVKGDILAGGAIFTKDISYPQNIDLPHGISSTAKEILEALDNSEDIPAGEDVRTIRAGKGITALESIRAKTIEIGKGYRVLTHTSPSYTSDEAEKAHKENISRITIKEAAALPLGRGGPAKRRDPQP